VIKLHLLRREMSKNLWINLLNHVCGYQRQMIKIWAGKDFLKRLSL
jgi:hypothetical protein